MSHHTEHTIRAIGSVIALLLAAIIFAALLATLPVFGLRSTVLISTDDPSKNAALEHVVENVVVIGRNKAHFKPYSRIKKFIEPNIFRFPQFIVIIINLSGGH